MKRPPSSHRTADTDPAPDRPPIWIAGQQQPKFDLRAWAVVGHGMARRGLVPKLGRSSGAVAGLGAKVASGRYRIATGWMGRAERFVPSRVTVGGVIIGLAARLAEAKEILQPTPDDTLAYPNLIRRPEGREGVAAAARLRVMPAQDLPAHSPPPSPPLSLAADNPEVPRTDPDAQALNTIRALIHAVPDLPPAEPAPRVQPVAPQPAQKPRSPIPAALARSGAHLAAHAFAWGGLVLAMPFGLAQAAYYHLNGGDLREWD